MSDFIKSDYCRECEGEGKVFVGLSSVFDAKNMELKDVDQFEQCFSCEELHELELKADRRLDELKGN